MANFDITYVMPVRNGETTMASSIFSIKEADPDLWERTQVLVVDDGSDDATPDILESLNLEFPNIHHYRQPHAGKGAARNLGNKMAQSDILAVLDADDWNLGGRSKEILKTFERYGRACVFYSSFASNHIHTNKHGQFQAQEIDPSHLRETGEFRIGHSTMAYRKDVALRFPYSESPRHDDWWFQWQLWSHGVGFCWSDKFLLEYRISQETQEKETDDEKSKRILEKKQKIMQPFFEKKQKEKESGSKPEKVAH